MSGKNLSKERRIQKIIIELNRRFPGIALEIRPLKIGIFDEIVAELESDPTWPWSMNATQKAVHWYTHCARYLKALKNGGQRYGMNGEPCGEISQAEIDDAVKRLANIKNKKTEDVLPHSGETVCF